MPYYAHATDPVTFGTFFVLYYATIPTVIFLWFWKYYYHIRKGNYHLKQLAILILLAFVITSFSGFKLLDQYFYIYSPVDEKITCYSSSCILSSPLITEYNFAREDFEKVGVPSIGFMRMYRVYDTGISHSLLSPKKLNHVVITRPLFFIPAIEVYVYSISEDRRIAGRDKFYLIWPKSPGKLLTEKFDFKFSVMIVPGSS
ncbi:hypothetical protein OCC_13001 [Thermococcus litoralis DSM 5473]|uniref:Uncharacterized protein n=1 Tax=Thermococcus litoralis (strain ATCC 51850 / DSM 5473 / JCM 8560 / NS-C) TaxID=523849 RepID=H3ZRI9_THELN|nr:hypothetical protein [Thermococcus litoralis]EHR77395.1 hypothetical protein OCC_13001 [Thermococcus litoralis DSM 5473]